MRTIWEETAPLRPRVRPRFLAATASVQVGVDGTEEEEEENAHATVGLAVASRRDAAMYREGRGGSAEGKATALRK